MMKVLYVSYFWTSLRPIFESKHDIRKGMPGFILPLIAMKNLGWDIDFVFVTENEEDIRLFKKNYEDELIPYKSVKKVLFYRGGNKLKKLKSCASLTSLMKRTVDELLDGKNYDFVYGQSEYSLGAIISAKRNGVPCGQRQYGTFMYSMLQQKGRLRCFFSYPLEVLSYMYRKDFLLVTDDGTKGDRVYDKFARKNRFRFLFWVNGVDNICEVSQDQISRYVQMNTILSPSVFYYGRVAKWKRQDRAIGVIEQLHNMGIPAHLYIAGQMAKEEDAWVAYLQKIIIEKNLSEYIHFLGAITREEAAIIAKSSIASLVMYDFSCLGNVFHELMSFGAVLICQDDNNSLDGYLQDSINGYLISSATEGAEVIRNLLQNASDEKRIRENAVKRSRQIMKTWDERVNDELRLIEECVNKMV